MRFRSDKEFKMKKEVRKQKKPVRMKRVWIVSAILILLSFCHLFALTVFERLGKYEEEVTERFDRLYSSIEQAIDQTEELTQSYDKWFFDRLYFIKYASQLAGDESSEFVRLGSRYLEGSDLYVISRNSRSMVGSNGASPGQEIIDELLNESAGKGVAGVYPSGLNRYYYLELEGDLLGVLRTARVEYDMFLDNNYTPDEILGRNLDDGDNFFFAVRDGIITNYPEGKHIGEAFSDLLIAEADLPSLQFSSSFYKIQKFDNHVYLTVNRPLENMDLDLYYAVPLRSQINASLGIVIPVALVFGLFLILFILYVYYLRQDYAFRMEHTKENLASIRYKILALTVIAMISVSGMAYYARTLYGLSYFIENYQETFALVRYTLKDVDLCVSDLEKDFDANALKDTQMISAFLSDYPEQRTAENLQVFSDIFSFDFLMMFDTDGKEVLTNGDYVGYSISTDPSEPSYVFTPLKNGIPYVISELQEDDLTFEKHKIIGVTTKDQTSHVDGFIQSVFYPENMVRTIESASLESTFDKSVISNVFQIFLINAETKEIIYSPTHEGIGESALRHGFDEEDIRSDFSGYKDLGYDRYFLASAKGENEFIFVGIPVHDIFSFRFQYTVTTLVLFVICLLIVNGLVRRAELPPQKEEAEETEEEKKDPNEPVTVVTNRRNAVDLTLKGQLVALKERWKTVSAEEKMAAILSRAVIIMAIIFSAELILRNGNTPGNTILSYILSGEWPRGINVFSVSAVLILLTVAVTALVLIRAVLNLLARVLTARAETLCHLIRSCVEYGGVIAILYLAFGYLGMDVKSLMASVGFLTLIIGFGTKSLITDIVAGLFIIFEQEFQVGDIIEVGGYRGMVKEIGMRTTKIVSWDKNVKIINNRDINSVLNLTMQNSFASVNFTIPITTSIDEVEEIFREELKQLPEKYPQIIGVPYFAGILSFSGGRMECRISAEVDELQRGEMEANLHREVQEILKRHDIPMK